MVLGQATVELKPFRCVTGVDPSENMIHSAREVLENGRTVDGDGDQRGPVIDFVQGSAENLDFLSDNSTDLVIAGTFGFSSPHSLRLNWRVFASSLIWSSSSSWSLVRLVEDVARACAHHVQGCNGRFLG